MSPHDLVLVIGLIVLAFTQLLVLLTTADKEPTRRTRQTASRLPTKS
jgi:hypothetical protein